MHIQNSGSQDLLRMILKEDYGGNMIQSLSLLRWNQKISLAEEENWSTIPEFKH